MEELLRKNAEIEKNRKAIEEIAKQISSSNDNKPKSAPSVVEDKTNSNTELDDFDISDVSDGDMDIASIQNEVAHLPNNPLKKGKFHWRSAAVDGDEDVSDAEDASDSGIVKSAFEKLPKDNRQIQNSENGRNASPTEGNFEDHLTGVSAEITIKLQKARIQALEIQVKQLTFQHDNLAERSRNSELVVKGAVDEKNKLLRLNKQLEMQFTKAQQQLVQMTDRCSEKDAELNSLRKDIDSFRKEKRKDTAASTGTENRLNKAYEEIDTLKQQLRKSNSDIKDILQKAKAQEEVFQTELRNFQKQKTELLLAFKKQQKLIDILRRQKLHLEASRLFSFTEEEFTKTLDRVEQSVV